MEVLTGIQTAKHKTLKWLVDGNGRKNIQSTTRTFERQ